MKRSAASVIPPHLGADAFMYIDAPCSPTYEGSARSEYDGAQYALDYTVRWVNRSQNQEAGRRLFGWYENDRILDLGKDPELDPND
ncbi:hypothetical protein, partial [Amycolatopsis sp. lyj-108]|uniref:hypothetical protein n=1 Tax=Amycolatopsis sp. lyj-108 TaxID=2789286 RepID=UPI00397941A1